MNIVWILVVALGVAVIQLLIYRGFGRRGLTYQRYFSNTRVYEGEKIELIEVLGNMKLLPMPWIRMEARISPNLRFRSQGGLDIRGDLYHHSVFVMGPYQRITRTHEITCLKRGCYQMDEVSLSCGDIFGLLTLGQTHRVGLEVLVYPPLLDMRLLDVPSRRWQGDAVVKRFIEPDPFLVNGIREYRPGDHMRDVHWPATARVNNLMVKTFDYTASPKLFVLVNIQGHADQWGDMTQDEHAPIEYLISLAGTYAAWARNNGVDIAVSTNARQNLMDNTRLETPFGGGEGHYQMIMNLLARIRILMRRTFLTYLDDEVIPSGISGADIVLLSCYRSQALEERAATLRAMGNSVTWQGVENKL